jgi:hypothetical protein
VCKKLKEEKRRRSSIWRTGSLVRRGGEHGGRSEERKQEECLGRRHYIASRAAVDRRSQLGRGEENERGGTDDQAQQASGGIYTRPEPERGGADKDVYVGDGERRRWRRLVCVRSHYFCYGGERPGRGRSVTTLARSSGATRS